MRKATLAVDHMSDTALWDKLESLLIQMQQPALTESHLKAKKAMAPQAYRIARELRQRGVQLQLGLG